MILLRLLIDGNMQILNLQNFIYLLPDENCTI